MYKSFVSEDSKNPTVCKLYILDRNMWYHKTACKQMIRDKQKCNSKNAKNNLKIKLWLQSNIYKLIKLYINIINNA